MENLTEQSKTNKFALILAGGSGTRLWPISTFNRPKQFLNLYKENIMINETIQRIKPLFAYENIFVIINQNQEELVNSYVDLNIPKENIINEPMRKDTAMCVFYATLKIKEMRGSGIITVLSSDHYIKNEDGLRDNIQTGIELVEKTNDLVIMGIKPTYPATGFGYVEYNNSNEKNYGKVVKFIQKPNYETAKQLLNSGNYYWNSGVYVWSTESILNGYKHHLPELYKEKERIENNMNNKDILKDVYKNAPVTSVDKAILENSDNIIMIKSKFEWMDIGSINDFFKVNRKQGETNVQIGKALTKNNEQTNIYNSDEDILIVTLGTKNLNIVHSNGVILVADKDSMHELPAVLNEIEEHNDFNKYI